MKGQSALEYVMTYGWVVIVLVIALALIYTIVMPGIMPVSKCELGIGLQCYSYKLNKADGSIDLILNQGLGKTIQVERVGCTKASVTTYLENLTSPVLVKEGVPQYISGGDSNNSVRCRDLDGNVFTPDPMGEPAYFGKLCIQYQELDSNMTRIACGAFSGRFE